MGESPLEQIVEYVVSAARTRVPSKEREKKGKRAGRWKKSQRETAESYKRAEWTKEIAGLGAKEEDA